MNENDTDMYNTYCVLRRRSQEPFSESAPPIINKRYTFAALAVFEADGKKTET